LIYFLFLQCLEYIRGSDWPKRETQNFEIVCGVVTALPAEEQEVVKHVVKQSILKTLNYKQDNVLGGK